MGLSEQCACEVETKAPTFTANLRLVGPNSVKTIVHRVCCDGIDNLGLGLIYTMRALWYIFGRSSGPLVERDKCARDHATSLICLHHAVQEESGCVLVEAVAESLRFLVLNVPGVSFSTWCSVSHLLESRLTAGGFTCTAFSRESGAKICRCPTRCKFGRTRLRLHRRR